MSPGSSPLEESPQDFARRIGLTFNNMGLLTRALTHRSYFNEHRDAIEDNERLEFLGDAVLDFMVGAWLYHRFPEMAEGQLTRLRAALVGNEQLAEFAIGINLGAAMRLGHGEAENGGRVRLPLLGSTFEALIGAVYLDQEISQVWKFMDPILEITVRTIIASQVEHHPKSILQEWSQSKGFGTPAYRLVGDSGPDHDKYFEVEVLIDGVIYGRGKGHSKQAATKDAAKHALEKLGIR
ncbi:MAG: ribonuclease III [Chloroflexi bacterium RBG_16_47_49]|nr:MAG: ribonuclease III [Chloroflexi bacterium RBG_16_47_49]